MCMSQCEQVIINCKSLLSGYLILHQKSATMSRLPITRSGYYLSESFLVNYDFNYQYC